MFSIAIVNATGMPTSVMTDILAAASCRFYAIGYETAAHTISAIYDRPSGVNARVRVIQSNPPRGVFDLLDFEPDMLVHEMCLGDGDAQQLRYATIVLLCAVDECEGLKYISALRGELAEASPEFALLCVGDPRHRKFERGNQTSIVPMSYALRAPVLDREFVDVPKSGLESGDELLSWLIAPGHQSSEKLYACHCDSEAVATVKQIDAACTINFHEAARILGLNESHRLRGFWSRGFFRRQFSFSKDELRDRIARTKGLAENLLLKSEDQRGAPTAAVGKVKGGYMVGCYDGSWTDKCFHADVNDAAADFVLAFWRMPRA